MTPRIAASLLLLVLLPVYIGSYPINHPTGKKDRARSLPVVISQYSSVRNSKNNQPTVTIVEPSPDDVGRKIAEQRPDNGKISQSVDTEKLLVSSHDKTVDQHPKPSQEIISSVTLTSDNASADQGQAVTNKKTETPANDDKQKDTQEVSNSEKAVSEHTKEQSENVNKPSATTNQQDNPEIDISADEAKKTQDAELPKEAVAVSTNAEKEEEGEKPVKSSDEKTETVNEEKSHVAELTSVESGTSDSEAATAIKDTTKVTTDEIGVAEEKPIEVIKSIDDKKKPEENADDSQIAATTPVTADEEELSPVIKQETAVIPAKEKTEVANKSVSKETTNSVKSENVKNKAAADQSIIKEVNRDTVTKNDEEHKIKQEDVAKNNEEPQVKLLEETKSSKPVSSEEPTSDDVGGKKKFKNDEDNNQMTPTKELKNGELFEEDRSFKGSLEEFSLAGIQDPGQFNKWSKLELSLGTNLDSFIKDDEDDLMNENVRAERDDKKTEEKKEKEREKEKEIKEKLSEKEKIYGKPFNKETKSPKKPIVLSDDSESLKKPIVQSDDSESTNKPIVYSDNSESTNKPIIHSSDPVDEYPMSRRKRSQDGDQKVSTKYLFHNFCLYHD